jgi:hypothetical protein
MVTKAVRLNATLPLIEHGYHLARQAMTARLPEAQTYRGPVRD